MVEHTVDRISNASVPILVKNETAVNIYNQRKSDVGYPIRMTLPA
jgi:hypothetical protein